MTRVKHINPIITKICLIILVLSIASCDNSVQRPNELEYLIGTWVLDSATYPRGNDYQKVEACDYLTFLKDSAYTFKTNCGCIHLDFKGKYFLLNNPKRGLKTITLVPDIEIYEGDTIRIGYDNFDIVKISNRRLQIVRETEFFDRNDLHLRFNKNEIYKKIK
ncbi:MULTISPECIES: hypothetical protein [Flavobacterium]|uniref:Lipocalin-like domain-containing protein n=2 Tax=Flavobacterium TaxID=237 RepID=A0A6V6ZDQ7_9FLAO|nr:MULTISPECIES: hypothetical protein [Flavobacterium]CAD0009056.1 hypothetical protein FLAT13_04715 [Flavobacterium salmonis]CAD0009931.1 hypothetical protein FLACHUCJ7_04571 [Flavobacterium chungangense]